MKTYKSLFITGALALAAGFTSCSDDEEYDFPGTTNNYVYQLDRSTSFKIVQTPTIVVSNIDLEIPVQCTQKAASDIKVTFGIDNSLIDAYNEEHETNYVALPDDIVLLETPTVIIPHGKFKAEENIKIVSTDDEAALKALSDMQEYLVPIVRMSVEGSNAVPSEDANPVNYVKVSVVKDNIKHGATQDEIKGKMVIDQSAWTISLLEGSYYSGNNPSCLFDGEMSSYTTMSSAAGGDLVMQFDLGKEYTFDALTLYYGYIYEWWGQRYEYTYGQLTTTMNISTSQDGQTWQKVGNMENGDSNVFMMFYAPITARYIKVVEPNMLSIYSPQMTAGIFNIYAL